MSSIAKKTDKMIRINEILAEQGLSQKDLAERMGVSVQYVNALVKERNSGSIKMYNKIAGILGVPFKELFE